MSVSIGSEAPRAYTAHAFRSMASAFAALLIPAAMALATSDASAQTIQQQIISGANQTVAVTTVLPERFAVRMTTVANAPIVGLLVRFQISHMLCFPELPPGEVCPPPDSLYGRFAGLAPTDPTIVEVLTDTNGIATAPSFRAGTTAGSYEVYSSVPPQTVDGIQYPSGLTHSRFAITQQNAQQNVSIPMLGTSGMILLVVAFAAIAAYTLRRRRLWVESRR